MPPAATQVMKALVYDQTLQYRTDCPEPRPGRGEAVVRVLRAGICATDIEITRGYMGFAGVPGHEFVGEVVEGSSLWQGRRVVGEINCVCGRCDMCARGLSNHCRDRTVLGILGRDGAFAEYVCLPEANLHEVPDAVSDDQAVFVEPLAAACQILKQCTIDSHTRVAVLGSGRLGQLVAQVMKSTGCRMMVVGRNLDSLRTCERLGMATALSSEVHGARDYDVVVDCTGAAAGLPMAFEWVRPRGTVVLKSTYVGPAPPSLSAVVIDELTLLGSRCGPFADALHLLATARVDVEALVTRVVPLERGIEGFEWAASREVMKVLIAPGA